VEKKILLDMSGSTLQLQEKKTFLRKMSMSCMSRIESKNDPKVVLEKKISINRGNGEEKSGK
jgi:hypothetical protein